MSQRMASESLKAQRKQALRDWLAQANGNIRPEELQDDTPIIEQGVIKSLQVMDLINMLEELTGRSVDVERITPGVFASINTISRAFLEEDNNGG